MVFGLLRIVFIHQMSILSSSPPPTSSQASSLPLNSQGTVLTGAKLAEASGIEEPSSPHGVELEHEQDEGQTAEDEGKHHEDLYCLQPACNRRQRWKSQQSRVPAPPACSSLPPPTLLPFRDIQYHLYRPVSTCIYRYCIYIYSITYIDLNSCNFPKFPYQF